MPGAVDSRPVIDAIRTILMPRLSESMVAGTNARWLKSDGQDVREAEKIVGLRPTGERWHINPTTSELSGFVQHREPPYGLGEPIADVASTAAVAPDSQEPHKVSATPAPAAIPLSMAALGDCLRLMHEIRFFEKAASSSSLEGSVRGSTHLCQGQEATAVGACRALRPGDQMLCTYRGHGAVIAKGAPLDRSFAEILGKANGLCGGKGGSMHLTDVTCGALGSFAIVGGHLPIALGVAFAVCYRGDDAVCLCFFGEGAANIGAFHEALNLASVWKLPVIFVCENNLYGEYSPIATTTPITRLSDRGASYAMTSESIDGNDVCTVYDAVAQAAAAARAGAGPTLLEARTYRHKGHSRTDPASYRPKGELEEWLTRDPIKLLEDRLQNDGMDARDLASIRDTARRSVAAALTRARGWPEPALESRFDHVYT